MDLSLYRDRLSAFSIGAKRVSTSERNAFVAQAAPLLHTLFLQGKALSAGFETLHNLFLEKNPPGKSDVSWADLWKSDRILPTKRLEAEQLLTDLDAFAHWGLWPAINFPSSGDEQYRNAGFKLERYVRAARALCDAGDRVDWGVADFPELVLAAEARIGIDMGLPISPDQLAALAGVDLGRTEPMPPLSSVRPGAAKIESEDALRWLEGQDGFKSSVWKFFGAYASSIIPSVNGEAEVIVPVAGPESSFYPVIRRDRKGHTKWTVVPVASASRERLPVDFGRGLEAVGVKA